MGRNILIINGSPKGIGSNTYRLASSFVKGMGTACEKDGNAPNIETLNVNSLNIKPCMGCFSCWSKTPGKCVINDDMSEVIEKMLWADITIWSFPLYYFGIPGALKNLIDRQLPMNMPFMATETASGGHPSRYDMSGKKTVLISTCGFYTAGGNYDSVIAMFDRFYGKGEYERILCGQGELFRVKELSARTDEYLANVEKAGAEYAAGGSISADTKEELEKLLYPRETFEAMADASWGVDQTGEKLDESHIFTKQMAALYNKDSYPGHDLILEMNYTDIGKRYQIRLGKDGSQVLDTLDNEYTTRINTPYSVWQSIAAGEIEGSEALMKHMYTIDGDFDLLLNWDNYFGSPTSSNDTAKSAEIKKDGHSSPTNMLIMLLPWMIFWVAAAIDNFYGSLISIAACAVIPLIFYRNKKTVYDIISPAAIIGASVALLLGCDENYIVPITYLAFGVMWLVSCGFKIPLTAHYSMNNYGMDKALKNPIFIKTNRILTAAWGVLYIATSIWTYFIMFTPLSSYVGLINSVTPIFMGVFTAWFQKWYPARVASGK